MDRQKALHVVKSNWPDGRFMLQEALRTLIPEFNESKDEAMRKFISHELACLRATDEKGSDRYEELTTAIDWIEKHSYQKSEIKDDVLSRFAFYQYDDQVPYLSSVFVKGHNRKHGRGSRILKIAEEVAKILGVSRICLKVERGTWIEEWYKRNGYEYLTDEGEYNWLEKLIEQKPTDKVEPKFKVGDWITNGIDFTFQVISIEDNNYLRSDDYFIDIETADKTFRLWTIQDAKDGDVLYTHSFESDCVFLYQNTYEIEPNRNVAVAYCCIDVYANKIEFGIQGPDCIDVRNIKPATKEQRDLLFRKMKEAGYEWDAENKELKKIEQKPAWSEEDEKMLNSIIEVLEVTPSARFVPIKREIMIPWLKSIRERMKGE